MSLMRQSLPVYKENTYKFYAQKSSDITTWECHQHDQHFLNEFVKQLPPILSRGIGRRYSQIYSEKGRRNANLFILGLSKKLKTLPNKIAMSMTYDDIRDMAKTISNSCSRIICVKKTDKQAFASVKSFLSHSSLPFPSDKYDIAGRLARVACPDWWTRQLRKILLRTAESIAIQANIVHRLAGIYASDQTVSVNEQARNRNRALLEQIDIVNEMGESFRLSEIVEHSQSNPKNRRAELMVRLAGFEQIANKLGHISLFLTLTCPGSMHASFSRSGQPNPKYKGFTPKESQKYLSNLFAKIRSALHRRHIKPYGIRVAEPQHDGTPHWHLLLFLPANQSNDLLKVFNKYSLDVDGDEPGAQEHRFKVVEIDKEKGTAVGYIAKYISKNIDGFGIETDLYGKSAVTSSQRVNVWASTWGIRQFQFIGGPPVSIWRECRRLDSEELDGLISEAVEAADIGNWAKFVEILGGPNAARKDRPIQLFRSDRGEKSRYGEAKVSAVIGIRNNDELAISREHKWEIQIANREEGLIAD